MDTTSYDCIGSSFDDFLKEEGLYEECEAAAIKSVIAWELQHFMDEKKITKVEIAKRMGTSRSLVDKILDAKNTSITLATILKVANVIGKSATFNFGEKVEEMDCPTCPA
ncbi:helix-turn-helix domain-containing protein [Solidesulfovibrio alcoholivorans]|uniref:helix-turn-helix domain-containing protein n=1 Tax=Solidesulfovibrio alcoholivorans TaxID=81406 RepID=UPI0009FC8E49|nr:helix-turn-helix transcriptional regulator [Solidesulfovibrio alcoholivorans]